MCELKACYCEVLVEELGVEERVAFREEVGDGERDW